MAVQSGSFNTTAYSNRNLVFSWSLQSQSIPDNTSTISWSLKGGGSASGYYLTQNITLIVNGVTVFSHGQSPQIKLWNGTTVASGTATITHETTGTKTFTASCTAGIYVWSPNVSGSGSWELPTIPRYATISQSLQSKTETTAVIKWTSDSTCDYLWYSTNNGTSWTGVTIGSASSGTYTISGLSANTTYQIKTSVRRKDSQLSTNSSAMSVTTYNWPHATNAPDFYIGNSVTITLYNPLSRTVTVEIIGANNSTKSGGTVSTTSISGFNNASWTSFLYGTIPNATSASYKVKVTYGTHEDTYNGGNYSAKEKDCLPTIGTVSYRDTNTTSIGITGDNSKIVRNQSTVFYTASGLSAKNSATVASVSVSVNGNTYSLTMNQQHTEATGGSATIDSGMNVTATVIVTDSRGFSSNKSMTVTMLDWSLPSAIIKLQRQYNFYTTTYITVDASYAYINGNNQITISYWYRKSGTSPWSSEISLQDNVQASFQADNEYAWDVYVRLVDSFGGTTNYQLFLPRGTPIFFVDRIKNSVGINCFPKDNMSLEVNGYNLCKNIMTRGLITSTTNLTTGTYTKVPLDTIISSIGDKLTVPTTDNNGITIGANVSKVLVSGKMVVGTSAGSTTSARHLRIIKGYPYNYRNTLGWAYDTMWANATDTISIPPILADVTEGDVIYLVYHTTNGDDTIAGGSSSVWLTTLTVEVVG